MAKDRKDISDLVIRIASSAQGAVNLIEEFLSARRIQDGTLRLKPLHQPLRPIVDTVLGDFAPIAAARSIALEMVCHDALMTTVDRPALTRVIGNLVSNALKFTPKKGNVKIEAMEREGDTHILVSDTGSGIDPSELQRLFQRFSRLERHHEVAGTGLGLFVVKSIVDAHGGRIHVASKVGVGTTFEIVLPQSPPVNAQGEVVAV